MSMTKPNQQLAEVSCPRCDYREFSPDFREGDQCPECFGELVEL